MRTTIEPQISSAVRAADLRRVRQRYADFGPTLAAEHLAQEGLTVSRETLRKWMVKASLWRPSAPRIFSVLKLCRHYTLLKENLDMYLDEARK